MIELENVLLREYGAELCLLPSTPKNVRPGVTIFCVLLAFYELSRLEAELTRLKRQGSRVVVYVFDCWDAPDFLYSRRRKFRDRLRPSLRIERAVDQICIPFRRVIEQLKPEHQPLARHIPLGVDPTLVNGLNRDRPISVLAYGRQPPEITRSLAEKLNDPSNPSIFHHTDHLTIAEINDATLHRRHFWKLAQSSMVALAYDAKLTSPHRVPISIVGQRFYESLAAGCIVAGKRPATDEADELLDWPDAIVELPDKPADAIEALQSLCGNATRAAEIRERNVEEVRARHDWRHRIPLMFD
jgi:hypothetical protein